MRTSFFPLFNQSRLLCFILCSSSLSALSQASAPHRSANMGALGLGGGIGTIGEGLTELSMPGLLPPAQREGSGSLIAQDAMGYCKSDDEAGRLRCIACGREGNFAAICQRCAGRMKTSLLGAAERTMSAPGSGRQFYCLQCHELFSVSGNHKSHKGMVIPLGWYKGKKVAWASGEETWASIFANVKVQSTKRDRPILPYLLHKSEGVRCGNCSDIMTTESLYGSLIMSCSLMCWVAGGRGSETAIEVILTEAIIAMDHTNRPNAFCLNCRMGFQHPGDKAHQGHDCLSVRTDSDGHRPRVVIPTGHRMEQVWNCVKKEGGRNEVLIRDDCSLRCLGCRMRLVDEGDTTCSLGCSLAEKTRLVPRSVQLKALISE
ncbi:unnamed protein product [Urochloa humidicola]